jgi:hypothetical protein
MCVQQRGLAFERPAGPSDFEVLARHFPGFDFRGLYEAMSVYGFRPLVVDLVMVAAVSGLPADEYGVRSLPFSGLEAGTGNIVKLPVMDGVVDWMENSALGSAMWDAANAYLACQRRFVAFTMNCNCISVDAAAKADGRYGKYLTRFNASRAEVVGRTNVVWRDGDDISGTDITNEQLVMWQLVRAALFAVPAEASGGAPVRVMAAAARA